jgi:5'-deoxynucleotidase YfbR-like HD superfamily hydrolase
MNQGNDNSENATASAAETQAAQSTANVGGPASANEPAGSQTSERKKQANRDNAKHSTGPKTEKGKFWSRYNAILYGFHARDVVIRSGDAKEDPEEFELLLEGLRRSFKPQDVMQECLVHDIAEAEWRLRRAARAEVGEIRRQTDSYYARQNLELLEDFEDMTRPFWGRAESKSSANKSALRIQNKLELLEQVRNALEKNGYLNEGLQNALDRAFGNNNVLAVRCHQFSQLMLRRLADEKKSSNPDLEQRPTVGAEECDEEKRTLLRAIDLQSGPYKQFLTDLQQAEARELQATLLASNLPPREFLDKLIPYENAQQNKKHKAIALLVKLQSRKM